MEKMRILAIDDNTVNLATLEQELKSKYEVIPMISGRRAIKYLYRENVDLILLDVEMPIMDGHRLTKLVKEDDTLKKIPLIIFSSLVNDEMRRKGEALGADAQLTKPEIGQLVDTIDQLIDKMDIV